MRPSRLPVQRSSRGALALLLALVCALPVTAQETHSKETIKAAYLYRFASYVEWPRGLTTGHAFVIAVVGAPDVARELRRLLPGHLINNQTAQVREATRVQDVADAQMLYVGANNADFLRAMRANGTAQILIVTDEEQGLDLGGALNFVTVENRVRFEVSLTAAERAQLKISSELLSVALRVRGGRRQSDEFCKPFSLPEDGDALCGIREALLLGDQRQALERPKETAWTMYRVPNDRRT